MITVQHNIQLPDIRNILGWLTLNEAAALQMCTWYCSGLPGNIVEIGSYCGKSAVVIGSALEQGCSGYLYCVDPHTDNMKEYGVDSYEHLLINIDKFKLKDVVFVTKMKSQDVQWIKDATVKMLFIDGDHEYESVKQDYSMFELAVIKHGLVCFHDSHEAGPQQVIAEAVQTQRFHTLMIADSLTVLRKDIVATR